MHYIKIIFDDKFVKSSAQLDKQAKDAAVASSDVTISSNITVRMGKRTSATKTVNAVITTSAPLDASNLQFYIDKLSGLQATLLDLDGKINTFMLNNSLWSDDKYIKQDGLAEQYQDKIGRTIIALNKKLAACSPTTGNDANASNVSANIKFNLPNMELPKFDGCRENYQRFINSFEAIIDKYNLRPFEKYSYLLKQLSGNSKLLVESLPADSLTYDKAKKLLDEAFCDQLAQQYAVIKKLTELKMNSEIDAIKWISESRILKDQVAELKITGDIFLQYFLWESLSSQFKEVYVGICNKSKPDLKDIIDNAFEANKRAQTLSGVERKTNSLATKISFDNKEIKSTKNGLKVESRGECVLCAADASKNASSHRIFNCEAYASPQDKIKKLEMIKGCIRWMWSD